MSFRVCLCMAAAAVLAGASPALAAFSVNFGGLPGKLSPFTAASGDNSLTFSSPGDPGAFQVISTAGLFSFAAGLGDTGFGDVLTITFARPVTSPVALTFGLEDLFGLNGADTLSLLTNTGVSVTAAATLNSLAFAEPEGVATVFAPGFTSLTISSGNPNNPLVIGSVTSVPEPVSIAVLAVGLAGLAATRRRGTPGS